MVHHLVVQETQDLERQVVHILSERFGHPFCELVFCPLTVHLDGSAQKVIGIHMTQGHVDVCNGHLIRCIHGPQIGLHAFRPDGNPAACSIRVYHMAAARAQAVDGDHGHPHLVGREFG